MKFALVHVKTPTVLSGYSSCLGRLARQMAVLVIGRVKHVEMMSDQPGLYCQTCGCLIRFLSDVEAQRMSYEPHNFIVDCRDCAKDAGWI